MGYDNSYGVQIINKTEYDTLGNNWPACKELINKCRSMADELDPNETGANPDVNKACVDAYLFCVNSVEPPMGEMMRNFYDITTTVPFSYPPKYYAAYFNSGEVQRELGVPLNITGLSTAVYESFLFKTGDFVRGHQLAQLGGLLDKGVKVALVYGDRDYQCNCESFILCLLGW